MNRLPHINCLTNYPPTSTTPVGKKTKSLLIPVSFLYPHKQLLLHNPLAQLPPKPLMNPRHPPPPNSDKENHAETIILCDSNGRYLQPSLLCPNTKNSYIRCPTLTHVNGILEKTKFTKPTCSIVHTGTNDIKHSSEVETLAKKTVDIVDNIQTRHPNSQIIISSLLPRNDELHNKAEELNTLISSSLDIRMLLM